MPATRKPSAQSTISFGGNHSKITKPGAASQDKNKTSKFPVIAKSTEDVVELPSVEEPGHVSLETATAKHAEVEIGTLKTKKTEDERRAEAITDMQIKKYWRAREAERIAPRVHQQGLIVEEKILRLFDMTSHYGPCIGIARMKRWVRANKLGLNPPIEVLAVLLKEEQKGNNKIERAYVDELMNSKFGIGEA